MLAPRKYRYEARTTPRSADRQEGNMRFSIKSLTILLCLLCLAPGLSKAQTEDKPEVRELTVDMIMEGEDFVGSQPTVVGWSRDSGLLYFRWKKPGEDSVEWYSLSPENPSPVKITMDDVLKNPPLAARSRSMYSGFRGLGLTFDKERRRLILNRNGDISLKDLETGEERHLVVTDARESGAVFSHDQKKILFQSGDNLFSIHLADGTLQQLTSFTREPGPERPQSDAIDRWYREQQRELFQEFKQGRGEQFAGGMNFALGGGQPRRKPHRLREEERVTDLQLFPSGDHVLFTLFESLADAKNTIVPYFVTRSGYTETRRSHIKAAEDSYRSRAGILSVKTGDVTWIDFGQGDRVIAPSGIYWSPDGRTALMAVRSEDRKDAWLMRLDLEKGGTEIVEHVHDDAWIGRLGLTNILWSPDSKTVFYISEKDGFARLFRKTLDGGPAVPLTPDGFEVTDADLSANGKTWYLTSSEAHPGERNLYAMPLNGGQRIRLTPEEGHNDATLSPDEKWLAVMHSTATHPAELYFKPNKPGMDMSPVTESTTEAFRSFRWAEPEVFSFEARDGFDVYARLYRPAEWHANRPGVIFIHGAGYLQNAHKGWSSYYREYMFHNFLLQQGYLVMDVDYRGSAGYGRDCRTAIYRHMGGKDLDDIVDAARYMVGELEVNREAIGLYGGSYGGFLTLMGMFTQPDVFAAGAALRPVTDWAHYHPAYTVDILNRPHQDEEAYEQSSPIYFAEGLKGALLICHGMVDTNVHFQDTARLIQRLVELRKENWEAAVYPVEGHSFHNGSSWADEYKRIFKLFENNLK
jgi:dipeptidyl aminopeptidase/acylaminoacyl peptidase